MLSQSFDYFSQIAFEIQPHQQQKNANFYSIQPKLIQQFHQSQNVRHQSQKNRINSISSTFSKSSSNKLPINLFHNSAQYRKLLITNGKYIEKRYIDNGTIQSLEFLNEPLFAFEQQRKSQYRHRYALKRNKDKNIPSKNYQSITDCCCSVEKQCIAPIKDTCNKHTVRQKNPYVIKIIQNNEQYLKKKYPVKIQNKQQYNKSMSVTSNKKKQSNKTSIVKRPLSEKLFKRQQQQPKQKETILKRRHVDSIDNILMKSVCKFQNDMKIKKINQFKEKQKMQAKKLQLKKMNEYIRNYNKLYSKSRSKQKSKSKDSKRKISKDEIRFNYWNSIKDSVREQLSNSKYQLIKTIFNKKNNKHIKQQYPCHVKPKIALDQIQFLRKKHESEAQLVLQAKKRLSNMKKQRIQNALKKLEKNTLRILNKCHLIPFKPSQKIIQTAFTKLNES